MSETDNSESQVKRYPKKIIASFQLGNFIGLMMSQLYGQQLPYYYQSYISLDITLYVIANLIYMLFNMFNDPLLGYLCDRSKRFTGKWGKRFPFIIMGGIPYCFMVIFLFMAPSISQIGNLGVFFWLLFFLCLSDTVFSLYEINRVALFPDKIRHNTDRRIAGSITTILETIGVMMGILLPVLIIDELGPDMGYPVQGIIVATIAFVAFLLMVPGVREDKEMRDRRARLGDVTPERFFTGMKRTLKNKNFLAYMAFYVCYTSAMGLVMGSIPFFVQDFLLLPKIGEIILIFYVLAVILAAPIWYKLSFKLGIKKIAVIGGLLLGSMGIGFLFAPQGPSGLSIVIIILLIAGTADGAIISMTMPVFSSIIDEAAISTERRQEGLYNGTFLFFSRIGIAYQSVVYWLIQTFTGYRSGSTDPAELMGLRIQIGIFPLIVIFIGCIIFWKFYQITADQAEDNVKKLKDLDL